MGVAQGASENIMENLRATFTGECTDLARQGAEGSAGALLRLSENRMRPGGCISWHTYDIITSGVFELR